MRSFSKGSMAVLVAVVSIAAAGCGFDCDVGDERKHFNDCAALQAEYDALDPQTQSAERDDVLTCGEVSGCEVEP